VRFIIGFVEQENTKISEVLVGNGV